MCRLTDALNGWRRAAEREAGASGLGHHSPAFTLATYVHLLADDLPDAEFPDALTAGGDNEGDNRVTTSSAESGREAEPALAVISGGFSEEPRAAETAAGFS